jgi:hypothetical protein
MNDLMSDWLEAVRFTCEAHGVISMRLSRLMSGGAEAEVEATQMVSEKIEAIMEAQGAALDALNQGQGLLVAAERAYAPFCNRVHANSQRLMQPAH